ncbi:MAG: urate hydroxylase PuuD [Candidatus Eisenbacteria bacterium]
MQALLLEWLNLLLRWAHVVAAIMWIGDSFLFMWMDSSLSAPAKPREGAVAGEIWMMHSGGFYEVVKRRYLRPQDMPPQLFAFKWQAYSTWITGFLLFAIVYWLGGKAYLLERGVGLTHGSAIAISALLLVAGWFVYDLLWSSVLGRRTLLASLVSFALLAGTTYGLTQIFGGRAAYLQLGAMLGTIMAGNVWRRIIPSQIQMLAATRAGTEVDTSLGLRAKSRSTHNHYLTFPVLFLMLSSHFPSTYGHALNWLVLLLVMVFGASLKYTMNFRTRSDWRLVLPGVVGLIGALAITLQPTPTAQASTSMRERVAFEQVDAIMRRRCVTCHSMHPTNPSFPEAPNGVMFDDAARIQALSGRILVRAVQTQTMPLGNLTGMTDAERDTLGAWIAQGARAD